jgi:hypothetical protein
MYAVLISQLRDKGWQLYLCTKASFDYFVVTAVSPCLRGHVSKVCSLVFQNSTQGRHYVSVNVAQWCVTNVHVESNAPYVTSLVSRDRRAGQFRILANKHLHEPGHHHVVAGDLNMRQGEEDSFILESWCEANSANVSFTYENEYHRCLYDRCFYRALSGHLLMQQEHGVVSGIWYPGIGKLSDHQAVFVVLAIQCNSIGIEPHEISSDLDRNGRSSIPLLNKVTKQNLDSVQHSGPGESLIGLTPLQIAQWLHSRDRECVLLQQNLRVMLDACRPTTNAIWTSLNLNPGNSCVRSCLTWLWSWEV